jgi:hypothetical protein
MSKVKLILMNEGKVDYDFELEMKIPKKGEIITIPTVTDEYIHYKVKSIQHFVERWGEFKYVMVTAVTE